MKKIKKYLILLLLLLLLTGVGGLAYIGWNISDGIITPSMLGVSEQEQLVIDNPEDYGLEVTPFTVTASNGSSFRACLIKAAQETDSILPVRQSRMKKLLEARKNINTSFRTSRRGTIILSHSWGGRMEDMYRIAEYLTAADFDCLAYDLRAHGTRENEICMYGLIETEEVLDLIKAAKEKFGDLGSIGALGQGLGAAVNLQATAQSTDILSIVCIDSFATLKETVWHELVEDYGKIFALPLYSTGDQFLYWRKGFRSSDISPVTAATRITVPAMVVDTRKDSDFFSEVAQNIYSAFASKEKILYTPFPTQNSSAEYPQGTDELYALIIEWLVKHNHPAIPNVVAPTRHVPGPNPK